MGQIVNRDADANPATEQDLDTYRHAQAQLDRMRIPVLLPADNPHARLYIAALDGTGNSMVNDNPENWSVVAKIHDQIERTKPLNIASGYVEGTFTQEGLLRTPNRLLDGRFGHSFDERVETAYYDFCVQAQKWLDEDPQAQIRLAGVGFSRGAEELAALQRMIEERGIRDPSDARVVRDRDDVIQKIEYADKPLLVAPGKTLQVALLLDPVSTGVEDEERALPASAMGTFQISARDDRRDLFKNNDHIPPGFSEDMRNLNVLVAGAHSDAGDTYDKNGLGTLSFNLSVEFLNRLSDRSYLQKRALPEDPAQYVVHRSDQHMYGLYGTSGYDKDGVRDRLEDQSPRRGIQRKDPISPELEKQVERRTGPLPGDRPIPAQDEDQRQDPRETRPEAKQGLRPRSPTDDLLDRAFAAYMRDDDRTLSKVMDEYRQSPTGRAWEQQQREFSLMLREQEQQEELQRQAALAQQQSTQRGPVMRM